MLGSAHGIVVDFAELSDAGRDPDKQINEDASGYAETPFGHLAVVCDGMGGHSGGREASHAAVRTLMESARKAPPGSTGKSVLTQSIERANDAVYAIGADAPVELRPGSTCVVVLLSEARAEVAHAGDSRAYLVRASGAERLTRDHSMVQELMDSGMLEPSQAASHPEANKITRALGIAPRVEVEVRPSPVELRVGDTLLLCSDGLTDLVDDREIGTVVGARIQNGAASVCQELIRLANERGGHDNITALVLHVVELTTGGTAPTIVQRGAGRTLVTDASPTIADGGPSPTVYDEPAPRTEPGLTRVDTGDRVTEPGLSVGASPRFTHDEPPQGFPTRPPPSRLLTWLILGVALTVLGGLGAWALVRLMHKGHQDGADEVVPPPPSAPERWRPHRHRAPATSVSPEVDPTAPEPSASSAPDAEIPTDSDSGFP